MQLNRSRGVAELHSTWDPLNQYLVIKSDYVLLYAPLVPDPYLLIPVLHPLVYLYLHPGSSL